MLDVAPLKSIQHPGILERFETTGVGTEKVLAGAEHPYPVQKEDFIDFERIPVSQEIEPARRIAHLQAVFTQGFQFDDILAHVAGNAFEVGLQHRLFFAVFVPVVDLQRNQNTGDNQQKFAEAIGNVFAKGACHEQSMPDAS